MTTIPVRHNLHHLKQLDEALSHQPDCLETEQRFSLWKALLCSVYEEEEEEDAYLENDIK